MLQENIPRKVFGKLASVKRERGLSQAKGTVGKRQRGQNEKQVPLGSGAVKSGSARVNQKSFFGVHIKKQPKKMKQRKTKTKMVQGRNAGFLQTGAKIHTPPPNPHCPRSSPERSTCFREL